MGKETEFVIKPMETPEEMDGKGYVHWKSWHETYASLTGAVYLERITLEKCKENARCWSENTLVAKSGDKVVGFLCYGKSNELPDCGEVYALYVLRECHGTQIGYQLMNAAMEQIREYSKVNLWVLQGNERAIRFYERYGFRFDGTSAEIMMGRQNTKLRMVYER
ncbi:MAG: GNAT family N-acetyltransferase [Lachnospiraceae bacterium]|nr:GNAT family N-acetyltransferase [Lachnospiraceae bacterium]